MKTQLLILFLVVAFGAVAQTESMEYLALNEQLNSGKLSTVEFQNDLQKWNKNLDKFGDYPNLQVNDDGEVHFSFLLDLDQQAKDDLYNHCLEWMAVELGLFPNQLYTNAKDGKVVFSYSMLTDYELSCQFRTIVTVKAEKVLCEFVKFEYNASISGYYQGEHWVEDQMIHTPIEQLFPVCLKDPSDWKRNLALFQQTNVAVNGIVNRLRNYLANYEENNDF